MSLSLSAAPSTPTSTSDLPEISLSSITKKLASRKPAVRIRMVRNLSSLLPRLPPLHKSTLLEIWKGIFFCYWHSDNSVNQSNLATTISALISTSSHDFAMAFLDAALATLRREWGNMTKVDKLYLLVRSILKHTFLLLRSNSSDLYLLWKVMNIIEERALGEVGGAPGFCHHVVEIFPEELIGFQPVNKESLELVIKPFLNILEKSRDPILAEKVTVHIFEKCLVNGGKYLRLIKTGGEIEKGSEIELFGIMGLIMRFHVKLIHVILKAKAGTRRPYILDDLWDLRDRFLKLERHRLINGIEIEILVPEQIETLEIGHEFAKDENGEGPSEKITKKRKKNKNMKEKGEKEDETLVEKNSEKKNKKKKMKIEKESNCENENGTKGDESEIEDIIKRNHRSKTVRPFRRLRKLRMRKKVGFSLKDNVEWEPGTPLPPISVRLPPPAMPRGSALKKGVPAGPIGEMETPVATKRRPVVMSEEARKTKSFFCSIHRNMRVKRKCRKGRSVRTNQRNLDSSCDSKEMTDDVRVG